MFFDDDIEDKKESLQNSMGIAKTIQNVGIIKKNTEDIMLGTLVEGLGKRIYKLRAQELENLNSNSSKSDIFLEDTAPAEPAELVVENDVVYIKGDPNKTDLLAEIKKERQRAEFKKRSYEQQGELKKAVELKNKMFDALNENFVQSEELHEKLDGFKKYFKENITFRREYKGDYTIPSANYYDMVKDQITQEKNSAEKMASEIKVGGLFKRKKEKEKETLQAKINECKKDLAILEDINENFLVPFYKCDENENCIGVANMINNYERFVDGKIDEIEYQIYDYNKITKMLNDHACLGKILSRNTLSGYIIKTNKEVAKYLEENNLQFTELQVLTAINNINNDDIKLEINNFLENEQENENSKEFNH